VTAAATDVLDELARFLRRDAIGSVHDPIVGWTPLLALADRHRLLPAVWSALVARGVRPLPARLRDGTSPLATLERAYAANDLRVRAARVQLERVLDALEAIDAAPIPIKGAHWLLCDWLLDPGARVMIDLDVVVTAAHADAAVTALESYGYVAAPFDPFDGGDHQLAPMTNPRWPGAVELHLEAIVGFHRRLLHADELRTRTQVVVADGASRVVPSATDAVLLLIGHAQLQDESAKFLSIPLRALHDLTNLAPTALDAVDWDLVAASFRRARASVALAGFAVAAAELGSIELPVSTRGGREWWHAARYALDHERPAHWFRETVSLPRALRVDRMRRLYGVDHGMPLARARARHVVHGVTKRLPVGAD
jgi:hypothetical protein